MSSLSQIQVLNDYNYIFLCFCFFLINSKHGTSYSVFCPVVFVVPSFSVDCVDTHPHTILLVHRLEGGGGGWIGASSAKTKTII